MLLRKVMLITDPSLNRAKLNAIGYWMYWYGGNYMDDIMYLGQYVYKSNEGAKQMIDVLDKVPGIEIFGIIDEYGKVTLDYTVVCFQKHVPAINIIKDILSYEWDLGKDVIILIMSYYTDRDFACVYYQ